MPWKVANHFSSSNAADDTSLLSYTDFDNHLYDQLVTRDNNSRMSGYNYFVFHFYETWLISPLKSKRKYRFMEWKNVYLYLKNNVVKYVSLSNIFCVHSTLFLFSIDSWGATGTSFSWLVSKNSRLSRLC